MMVGFSSCARAPWAPGSNLAVHVNRAIDDRPAHTEGCHLLASVSVSKPSISQIKEDTIESSVPAREFNLKAYAVIT